MSIKQCVEPESTRPVAEANEAEGRETEMERESEFAKAAALRRTIVGASLELSQPSGDAGGGLLTLFPPR